MIEDQPPPKPSDGPAIWDLVIADLNSSRFHNAQKKPAACVERVIPDARQRDEIGEKNYKTRLRAHNGRDSLIDAYQESLDGSVYLRQAMEEGNPIGALYYDALDLAINLRDEIFRRDGK